MIKCVALLMCVSPQFTVNYYTVNSRLCNGY